jgi:beta-glucanase (GH16 family)
LKHNLNIFLALTLVAASIFVAFKLLNSPMPIKKYQIRTIAKTTSNTVPGLPNPSKNMKWNVAFSDEFNSNTLDSNKWNTCYDTYSSTYDGCTNAGNYEQEWYKSTQVSEANGAVTLTANKQSTVGQPINGSVQTYPYVSGMLSTGKLSTNGTPKWTGSYGYYEMRAKLPSGTGLWPAFWLLPVNDKWPPEIDIMEMLGNDPNNILLTYFWNNGVYPPPKDTSTYTGTNFSEGWHTFAINWEPNSITWYIDGVERKQVNSIHVPNTPMQIIANLAVGGTLPGNPTSQTVFPASMKIDYIRVYNQVGAN